MDEAAGLSLDVVAYAAPQEPIAVNTAVRRGQPWTILASTCTSGKAVSTASERGLNVRVGGLTSSSHGAPEASPLAHPSRTQFMLLTLYAQLTDCDPATVGFEMPVELCFRRIHEGEGLINYFWKFKPLV